MTTPVIDEIETTVYAISNPADLSLRACFSTDNKIEFLTELEISNNFYTKITNYNSESLKPVMNMIANAVNHDVVIIEIVHLTRTTITVCDLI